MSLQRQAPATVVPCVPYNRAPLRLSCLKILIAPRNNTQHAGSQPESYIAGDSAAALGFLFWRHRYAIVIRAQTQSRRGGRSKGEGRRALKASSST